MCCNDHPADQTIDAGSVRINDDRKRLNKGYDMTTLKKTPAACAERRAVLFREQKKAINNVLSLIKFNATSSPPINPVLIERV